MVYTLIMEVKNKTMKQKRIHFITDEKTHKTMKQVALDMGISMGCLIRESIKKFLQKKGK